MHIDGDEADDAALRRQRVPAIEHAGCAQPTRGHLRVLHGVELDADEHLVGVVDAAVEGAQVAHGVGAVLAPAHPRQLQPLAHHRLARALHRAAADAPALG